MPQKIQIKTKLSCLQSVAMVTKEIQEVHTDCWSFQSLGKYMYFNIKFTKLILNGTNNTHNPIIP